VCVANSSWKQRGDMASEKVIHSAPSAFESLVSALYQAARKRGLNGYWKAGTMVWILTVLMRSWAEVLVTSLWSYWERVKPLSGAELNEIKSLGVGKHC
jgi:hypothetical protein